MVNEANVMLHNLRTRRRMLRRTSRRASCAFRPPMSRPAHADAIARTWSAAALYYATLMPGLPPPAASPRSSGPPEPNRQHRGADTSGSGGGGDSNDGGSGASGGGCSGGRPPTADDRTRDYVYSRGSGACINFANGVACGRTPCRVPHFAHAVLERHSAANMKS
ncbi:unnamed protein product, partial [Phaeothamnion confervicola]